MFEFNINNRPSNPTYSLYRIDFFTLEVVLVEYDIKCCNNAIYPNPRIIDVINVISNIENQFNSSISSNDIIISHIDHFIKSYSNTENMVTNAIISNSQLLYALSVDSDETDVYFVTLNESTI